MIPAVGYAHLPLPSVDNGVMPELVWIPALPQRTGPAADREVLTLPVVEEIDNDPPAAELVEMQTTTPESGVPPPPGFLPFLFPENDGGMDIDDICARFGGLASLTYRRSVESRRTFCTQRTCR